MKNPQHERTAVGSDVSALILGFEFHPQDWQIEQKKRLHDLIQELTEEDAIEGVTELPSGYRMTYSGIPAIALQLAVDLDNPAKDSLLIVVSTDIKGSHELEESLAKREIKGAYATKEIYERSLQEPSDYTDFVFADASSDGSIFYKLEEVEHSSPGRIHEWAERLQIRAEKKGKQDLASPDRIAERLLELGKDVVIGVVTIAVALLLHSYVSNSEVGEKLDLWAYEKLQGQILPVNNAPVAFDIGFSYMNDS